MYDLAEPNFIRIQVNTEQWIEINDESLCFDRIVGILGLVAHYLSRPEIYLSGFTG